MDYSEKVPSRENTEHSFDPQNTTSAGLFYNMHVLAEQKKNHPQKTDEDCINFKYDVAQKIIPAAITSGFELGKQVCTKKIDPAAIARTAGGGMLASHFEVVSKQQADKQRNVELNEIKKKYSVEGNFYNGYNEKKL
jgi:hypothetical protein